jgi:hypothetical protein
MLAMLFGCGFRRSELVGLDLDEIQLRQGHWASVSTLSTYTIRRESPMQTSGWRIEGNGDGLEFLESKLRLASTVGVAVSSEQAAFRV